VLATAAVLERGGDFNKKSKTLNVALTGLRLCLRLLLFWRKVELEMCVKGNAFDGCTENIKKWGQLQSSAKIGLKVALACNCFAAGLHYRVPLKDELTETPLRENHVGPNLEDARHINHLLASPGDERCDVWNEPLTPLIP
jgi:hypothetical protein